MSGEDTKKDTKDEDEISKENQEIIDEINEEEGKADKADENKDEEEDEKDKDTEKDKKKKSPNTSEDDDDAEDEGDDEDSEDDKDEADEGKSKDKPKKPDHVESDADRPIKSVPVKKYQGEKKKWKAREGELLKKIEDLGEKPSKKNSEDLDKLAEEYGMNKEFVKKLVDSVSSNSQMSESDRAKLDLMNKQHETDKADIEFNKVIVKLQKDYPDDDVKGNAEKIKELGYTEGFEKMSAYEIFFRYIKPKLKGKKKSMETGKKGESDRKAIDDDNFDFDKATDKEFDEHVERQASKEKRLTIR